MKKIFLLIAATALLAGVFTSCKKDEEVAPEVKYKVTFNAMDGMFSNGKSTKDTTVLSGSKVTKPSENPVLAGSVFDNWYADSLFNTVYDFNTAVTKDLTIYAKYTPTEKSMTLEQQAKYLNATGFALLGQIDTLDFQKLADGVKDFKNFEFVKDTASYNSINRYYESKFYNAGDKNWYVDMAQMSVKIQVDPTTPTNKVVKDTNTFFSIGDEAGTIDFSFKSTPKEFQHTYSAKAKVTTSNTKLLLAGKHRKAEETSKDSLIWVKAPETLALDVTVDGQAYIGFNFNLDCSKLPDSLATYIKQYMKKHRLPDLLRLLHFAVSGDIYVNGTSSYKIHMENISVDAPNADIDLTIYGKGNTPILSGKVSANATELLRVLDRIKDLRPSEIRDVAMATLKSFDLNVLTNDGARLVWNDNGNKLVELYLGEWTNHQIWFDPRDVSLATDDKKVILNTKFINTADPNKPVVSINDLGLYSTIFSNLGKEAVKIADAFKRMFN